MNTEPSLILYAPFVIICECTVITSEAVANAAVNKGPFSVFTQIISTVYEQWHELGVKCEATDLCLVKLK